MSIPQEVFDAFPQGIKDLVNQGVLYHWTKYPDFVYTSGAGKFKIFRQPKKIGRKRRFFWVVEPYGTPQSMAERAKVLKMLREILQKENERKNNHD